MPQVSSHLSQVRTSLRLLTRELRTAGSTDDFSYLSNDVGNVSIALANGETLPIQGTGAVSLPPLSCGQVMGSTADRDTDTVLDCDKWELLMSSIPAPRRTTERGGLGIVTSRPALCRFSYHIQSKGLRHSIETFEGVSPGAALEPTSPLHPGKSYHTAHWLTSALPRPFSYPQQIPRGDKDLRERYRASLDSLVISTIHRIDRPLYAWDHWNLDFSPFPGRGNFFWSTESLALLTCFTNSSTCRGLYWLTSYLTAPKPSSRKENEEFTTTLGAWALRFPWTRSQLQLEPKSKFTKRAQKSEGLYHSTYRWSTGILSDLKLKLQALVHSSASISWSCSRCLPRARVHLISRIDKFSVCSISKIYCIIS